MKKRVSGQKLSRTSNERKQLMRNLVRSLVLHGGIVTSEGKVNFVQRNVEKLITRGKTNSLNTVRFLTQETGDIAISKKIISYGELFKKRAGGYTRTYRLGNQKGDNTSKMRIEFVEQLAVAPVIVNPEIVKKADMPSLPEKKEAKKTVKKTVSKRTEKTA